MPESPAFEGQKNLAKTLPNDTRVKIAQETACLWKNWTEAIRGKIQTSDEGWALYGQGAASPALVQSQLDIKTSQDESRRRGITAGHIGRSVDSVHAQQHNATFPMDERFFTATPRNEAARQYRNLYESWAADNLAEAGFMLEIYNLRKNAIVDGTACMALSWRQKTGRHVTYEPVVSLPPGTPEQWQALATKMFGLKRVPHEDWVFWEGTALETLNFNDWRADPRCARFEDAGFIRRYYEPTWKVKKDYGLKEVASYHDVMEKAGDDNSLKALANDIQWSIGKHENEGKQQAMLCVRYDDFVVGGKPYTNHVAITLNDTELVWFGENPYDHGEKPYVVLPYIPVPGSIYGKSGIKDAIAAAHTYDTAATEVIDLFSWAAGPVFLKNVEDPIMAAQKDFKIKPKMTIPVKRMDALVQLPINTANAMALVEVMDRMDAQIRESTGATAPFTGEDPTQGKANITAFQVGAHLQGSNNRFQSNMLIFNELGLKSIIRQKHSNDRQYMTKTYDVPGFEDELTPDVVRQMDMAWIVTATQASMVRGKRIANLRQILLELPNLEAMGVVVKKPDVAEIDVVKILRIIFQESGLQETDEILKVIASQQEAVQAASGEALTGDPNEQSGIAPGVTGESGAGSPVVPGPIGESGLSAA